MGKKKIVAPKAEGQAAPVLRGETSAGPKKSRRLETARVYVSASYNNTVVTVADQNGEVVTWASAGSVGFSGPKKATPFAASKIIEVIAEKLRQAGVGAVEVYVKGIGGGRDSAVRSLAGHGFNILSIKDVTAIPHNGPRPPKVRRV